MPHLRVLCGPDPSHMVPITHLVNTNVPTRIVSDVFEGVVVANIKGFNPDDENRNAGYFEREDRKGVTWSIQVQGRFLQPHSADDILFGNTFERPLHLPWGSGAALKFMSYLDPNLTHDLTSPTKPWALSPLVATMPYFAHTRVMSTSSRSPSPRPPRLPSTKSLVDDNEQLYLAFVGDEDDDERFSDTSSSSPASSTSSLSDGSASVSSHGSRGSNQSRGSSSSHGSAHSYHSSSSKSSMSSISKIKSFSKIAQVTKSRSSGKGSPPVSPPPPTNLHTPAQRKAYFSSKENRKNVVFGPEDVITTDFCYGFLEFGEDKILLKLPGGITFDLLRYWDGQPVRFVCCERKRQKRQNDGSGEPWGRCFWCVAIELVE